MNFEKSKICQDCGMSSTYHLRTWLDELINHLLPSRFLNFLPKKVEKYFDLLLEKFFVLSRLVSFQDDFTSSDLQLRSVCFINEARKHGMKFRALRGPFGYTNYFQMQIGKRNFLFESLPTAEFLSKPRTTNNIVVRGKYSSQIIDDKELTKRRLRKGNFPTVDGQSFWFWQRKKAYLWAVDQLGFPLVVKPRNGSLSQHVTTNIQDIQQLKQAINKTIVYSPAFIIEKFIPNIFVYRATFIDFDFVACVQQIPANIVGDGKSTICQLIKMKNKNPQRGKPEQKGFILCQLVVNETTNYLLQEKGYSFSSVPPEDEIVYLQKDPFLKLGGDLIEVTPQVHPDNLLLFRRVAEFFDIRVVGIDFLAHDISVSWQNQPCAILELNNAPCIEMHHFPSSGQPQNVAKAIVDMVLKYYL